MFKAFDTSDFHILYVPQPAMSKTEKKLAGFRNLPRGWNYGRGRSIRKDVYEMAVALLRYINELGLSKTDVFPGVDGDVCITAYRFGHYLEVSVEVDLTLSVSHEFDNQEVFSKESLSRSEAKSALREAVKTIWGSSDLSTQDIMIGEKTDLTKWLLKSPLTEPALPSLASGVLAIPEEAYVNTFERFTQTYPEEHQFSGGLMNQFYRVITG